jgi:hypothetical protein
MSVPVGSLRDMSHQRRARRAKQVRRDALRAKKRIGDSAGPTLSDLIRGSLAKHPAELLGVASLIIRVAKTGPLRGETYLDEVLTGLVGVRNRETTALLTVIAELLVDDPVAQRRCRRELAQRDEPLPAWITALPEIDVYRVVRRTHVLGDVDELVIGTRLDGRELAVAVRIDHNRLSGITDAAALPESIDKALVRVAATSSDTNVVEMTPSDARAWIEEALSVPALPPETETWPLYRALVQWLVARLPEGGEHRCASMDWQATQELCGDFFASSSAAPFTDAGHRELLLELFETGSGDPLRWSPERVEYAIRAPYYDERVPLEVALDAPDLLRAFIPYAHAQSGIRDELTARAIAAVDALRSSYKRDVLRQARDWGLDDAV